MSNVRKSFLQRIKENTNKPKKKISISINDEDLESFEGLLNEYFPETKLSQAFNEMLLNGLEELRELKKSMKEK